MLFSARAIVAARCNGVNHSGKPNQPMDPMNRETLEQLSAVANDPAALKALASDLQINLETLKQELPQGAQGLNDSDLEQAVGGGNVGGLASLLKALFTKGCDGGPCAF